MPSNGSGLLIEKYRGKTLILKPIGDKWFFKAINNPGIDKIGVRLSKAAARSAAKKAIDAWS